MFDEYVDTFEASSSTVLVQRWRLIDEKARQQRCYNGLHNEPIHSPERQLYELVNIEPNLDIFRTAVMHLHHGVWT
jgi:hypothetical protein